MNSGATVYVNIEPGTCHGDDSAIKAIIQSKVDRVVIGIRNPMKFAKGRSINELRSAGIKVNLLEDYVTRYRADAI